MRTNLLPYRSVRIRFRLVTGMLTMAALLVGCSPMVNPARDDPEPPEDTEIAEILAEFRPTAEITESENIVVDGGHTLLAAKNEVLVHLDDDVSRQQFDAISEQISALGGDIVGALAGLRTMQIRVPDEVSEWEFAKSMQRSPGVVNAGLNIELASNDITENSSIASDSQTTGSDFVASAQLPDYPRVQHGWWIEQIDLHRAWRLSVGSMSNHAVIGIVDTGVPDSPTMMAERRLTRYFLHTRTQIPGIVEEARLEQVSDDDTYYGPGVAKGDHGLLVTCFAAGNTAPTRGVAWNNQVVSVDIDAEVRFRKVYSSYKHEGILGAMDKGADVINVSWGPKVDPQDRHDLDKLRLAYGESRRALENVVREAIERDVLLVFAAGNSSFKVDDERLGGGWDTHVLNVASVGQGNEESSFSNFGRAVDIAAPGQAVGCGLITGQSPIAFGTSGTSFSAPIVAGTAALMRSVNPSLTAPQVRELILRTASRNVRFGSRSAAGEPAIQLNACRAVQAAMAPRGTDTEPDFGSHDVDDQEYATGEEIAPLTLPRAAGGNLTCDESGLIYSLTGLPAGLSFDPVTRTVFGTPTVPGDYVLSYRVEDADGDSDTLYFAIRVRSTTTATGGRIYWAGSSHIRRADLDGSNVEDLVTVAGIEIPWDITLDLVRNKMYWTALESPTIWRANLDGSNVEDVIGTGQLAGIAIALDPAAGHLYWVAGGTIRRANLDGSGTRDLVSGLQQRPGGIALDVGRGTMYWIDDAAEVWRADLDGTNIEKLVDYYGIVTIGTISLVDGIGRRIALDTGRREMYWTAIFTREPGKSATMWFRAGLDGSDVTLKHVAAERFSGGLAVDARPGQEKVYWSSDGRIKRANTDGSNVEEVFGEYAEGVALELR